MDGDTELSSVLENVSFDFAEEDHTKAQTIVCFSHLRWNFVFQRPQQLMSRFAREHRVVYWEEPISSKDQSIPSLNIDLCVKSGVSIVTPVLPEGLLEPERQLALRQLLDTALVDHEGKVIAWYYTPMMRNFSRHLNAACTVYDCMDELSNFKFAPPELAALESELLSAADVVFTGGFSLYEAKRERHPNIHPFPSSVDRAHFDQARRSMTEPGDQGHLPHPRLGFYGVVDERMDLELLSGVADARPDWSLIIVGPVVKIDVADLPQRPNLFYLGGKSYDELPAYLAGWDVALMPFALNDSTRFISPTKTPEYLAAGKPVVSTPIIDVIRHYGALEGVKIADGQRAFVKACEAALKLPEAWIAEVDATLASMSWDDTHRKMDELIAGVEAYKETLPNDALFTSSKPAIRPFHRQRPFDYLVVGAGFAGSVLAERLAAGLGRRVLLIDRRSHIGGNAYDEKNAAGVLMHRYGPHIFHTNSDEVVAYLSRFTSWRRYEHRVLASLDGGLLVPMPINRTTINLLYGASLNSDAEAEAFLQKRAEPVAKIQTSEDVVISKVGRDLYERFFRGYTRKQWGVDPSELDKSVTSRVPTRTSLDDRYFTDSFQAIPAEGYTRMFDAMLDHPNITVDTGVDFAEMRSDPMYDKVIFTGCVDEYFDRRFGPLPYRSLSFRHETLDQKWFQSVGTVNYPDETVPYTRVSEYKHITGQEHSKTTITYEYPQAEGDPYYPIPREENQALFKRYEALALNSPDVHFVGRLATYRYYNMDQVVGQALATYRRIAKTEARASTTTAMTTIHSAV